MRAPRLSPRPQDSVECPRLVQTNPWRTVTAAWLLAACGQEPLDTLLERQQSNVIPAEAPVPSTDTLAAGKVPRPELGLFPMSRGFWWQYQRVEEGSLGRVKTLQIADHTPSNEGTPNDHDTFRVHEWGADPTQLEEETWVVQLPLVLRVEKLEQEAGFVSLRTTYEPGMPRFSFDWSQPGQTETLPHLRTEVDFTGEETQRSREQTFTVLGTDASVQVPAGQFDDCLWVERTGAGDDVQLWFAPGVGLVRELEVETGRTDELIDFALP